MPVVKSVQKPVAVQKGKESYELRKEHTRLNTRVKKLETLINEIELQIETNNELLTSPDLASDYAKLSEITATIEALEQKLLEIMSEWEQTTQKLETISQELI